MIKIENFSFRYPGEKRNALDNATLKIHPGEFVLILGDSGSGKTTLLRSLNGLIPHFYSGELHGNIKIDSVNTRFAGTQALSKLVGSVFQDPENQIIMQRVDNELAFPLENRGFERTDIIFRIEEVAALIGIENILSKNTAKLSGGELQKVAIAAALISYPKYLLLDEPTSQLDPNSAEEILSVLERINDELGIGILLVEHRMDRTMHRADKVIILNSGKIVAAGEPRIIAGEYDLDKMGIGYPQITRVAKILKLPYLPLTVKEGKKYITSPKTHHQDRKISKKFIGYAKNLHFSYPSQRVLRGANLELNEGEILGIVGNNGSGKTTMAKILTGLLKPEKGKVIITGKNIHALGEEARGKLVGMVFQNPRVHLFQESIYEDISFGIESTDTVEKIMKEMGLWEFRDKSAEELSGGERMLAAVAAIAVKKPRILILDEPTRGLSYRFRKILAEFLKNYGENRTVLIISHDMELIARICDRIAMLAMGRIIREAPAIEFMQNALLFTTQLNKVSRNILVEEDLKVRD